MKKSLLWIVVLVLSMSMVVAFSLAGCKTTTTAETTAAETTAAVTTAAKTTAAKTTTEEPVTLNILTCSGAYPGVCELIQPKLESEGIKLNVEAYDWNTYDSKQKLAMASGGGDYDVVFLPGNYVPLWAKANALIPVDSINKSINPDESDIYDSVKKFAIVDGKYYIVPFSAQAMVFYYRSDIYEQEGLQPPKTIDEMYETAKKLTKNGMYGIAYPGGPEEGSCSFWSYFLWSYGGTYFDESWKPQLNTPEAVQSAEMFAKILMECAPKGVTTWQNEETVAAFNSGNIAAMIQWPGYYGMVIDETQSTVFDKVAVAPVPAGPSGKAVPRFGAWGLGITIKGEAKMDAAAEFINAFCGQDGLKLVAKSESTSSKKINSMADLIEANPTIGAAAPVLDMAQERPAIPEAAQYIAAVGNAINSIVAGEPAKATLDELQETVYNIMEEAGYYN